MTIQIYHTPVYHIVIDDFLPDTLIDLFFTSYHSSRNDIRMIACKAAILCVKKNRQVYEYFDQTAYKIFNIDNVIKNRIMIC